MPGIAGIIGRVQDRECGRLLTDMLASMVHEPTYVSGTYCSAEQDVYVAWTAHEPIEAARLVNHYVDDDMSVVFSGECVRDDETPGDQTRAMNGAPAIAVLYRENGLDFVHRLNGMFSGLLVDLRQKRAFLFNDRYGLERIYYHESGEAICFASEAKALLRILPELRAFDDEGIAQYLALGCTTGSRTLFRGLRLLEAGSLWTCCQGGVHKERYFTPSLWERQQELTEEEFEAAFHQTFKRILPSYFEGLSRVGISLTGGLDTRMIMACLPHTTVAPVCYTFSAREHSTVDERLASQVAHSCGLEHHVLRIGDEFLSNFGNWVDRTVYATDGYAGATTAHETYFNVLARRLAPVRMTGNFGGEILRSVSTFKPLDLSWELFRPDFAPVVAQHSRVRESAKHPVTFAAFEEIPCRLFGTLAAARSQITFRTPYLHNALVALAFGAPATSRQSPRSALSLVQNSARLSSIPTSMGLFAGARGPAAQMRRLIYKVSNKIDYFYQEGVPRRIAPFERVIDALAVRGTRHRYLPYRHWFARELSARVTEVMTDPRTLRLPYWDRKRLGPMVRDHVSGRRNYVREINAVLSLEAAERLLIRAA